MLGLEVGRHSVNDPHIRNHQQSQQNGHQQDWRCGDQARDHNNGHTLANGDKPETKLQAQRTRVVLLIALCSHLGDLQSAVDIEQNARKRRTTEGDESQPDEEQDHDHEFNDCHHQEVRASGELLGQ